MNIREWVRKHGSWERVAPLAVLLIVATTDLVAGARLNSRREKVELAIDTRTEAIADRELLATSQRIRLSLERARELPSAQAALHLAIALTDGRLTLERGDASLASAAVTIGEPGWRVVGTDSVYVKAPRGMHKVSAISPQQITLEGGWQLRPEGSGGLIGVIELTARDFAAVRPNVIPGIAVYIF